MHLVQFRPCLPPVVVSVIASIGLTAQADRTSTAPKPPAAKSLLTGNAQRFADPPKAKRLAEHAEVWVDRPRKMVIMDGKVCLREGPLEMFACTRNTKEHESILSINTHAKLVHTALVFVGAEPGAPVRFNPKYVPASGCEVEVMLYWFDEDGKRQKSRAQEWVRRFDTKKAMELPWVFAGSGFWKDEETGIKYYQADGGDFICVSNFPSAMMDLPVESTQADTGLLFEAFTERIPPSGTKVRVVLLPKIDKKTERKVSDKSPSPSEGIH